MLFIISWILVFLVKLSDQKHKAYYFSNVNFNFNPKFGNLTADLSPWNNNPRTKPNLQVGKIAIWSNRDFSNIMVQLIISNHKTGIILLDQTINTDRVSVLQHNLLTKPIADEFMRNINFKIMSPFKKVQHQINHYWIVTKALIFHSRAIMSWKLLKFPNFSFLISRKVMIQIKML